MREEAERVMLLLQTSTSEADARMREIEQREAAAREQGAVDTAKAQAAVNAAIVVLFEKYASELDGITNRTLERECNLPALVAKKMLKRFEDIGLVSAPRNVGGKKGSRRFVLKTETALERYEQARAAVRNASQAGTAW